MQSALLKRCIGGRETDQVQYPLDVSVVDVFRFEGPTLPLSMSVEVRMVYAAASCKRRLRPEPSGIVRQLQDGKIDCQIDELGFKLA